MADVLRIKRRAAGGAAGAPTSLAAAELAFNEQDRVLCYGSGNSGGNAATIIPIAGPGGFLPLSGGTLTGTITVEDTVFINATPAGTQALVMFFDAGVIKWQIGKQTDNTFLGWDSVNARAWLSVSVATPGVVTIGESGSLGNFLQGSWVSNGFGFGSALAPGGASDLSRHIALYGTIYGLSITGGRLNYVVGSGGSHYFVVNSIDVAAFSSTGLVLNGSLTANGGVEAGDTLWVNATPAGTQGLINFQDAGVTKWQLGKQADNSFVGWDFVNTVAWLNVVTGVAYIGETAAIGNVLRGNWTATTPATADNSTTVATTAFIRAQDVVSIVTPTTGSTVTMAAADRSLYVNTAALAALTIRLPPTPSVGLKIELCFAASITTLTVLDSTGAAITGSPVNAFGPGAAIMMRYVSVAVGWVYWK